MNAEWLKNPVVAALCSGALGVFGTVLVWFLNRKKANKIQLYLVDVTSLLNIDSTIRPMVAATYKEHPVKELSQVEYAVINSGAEKIKDIALTFTFAEKTSVLQSAVNSVADFEQEIRKNQVVIKIPYLNTYRDHGEVLTLKVLCDGPVNQITIGGRGEGWTVQLMPQKPKLLA